MAGAVEAGEGCSGPGLRENSALTHNVWNLSKRKFLIPQVRAGDILQPF